MPRAFTETESAAIRAHLLSAGAQSFTRRGLRATTVAALAKAAGISKGAFYGFFDSKEALFLELVSSYERAKHAEIEAAVRADPRRGLEVMIGFALRATHESPLAAVLMSDEGLGLLRALAPEDREELLRRDELLVQKVQQILGEAGVALEVPDSLLVALMRSLVFLGWHRQEVGPEIADELAAWLTPTLCAALLPAANS